MDTRWTGYLTNKVKDHRWRTRVTSKTWEGWQRWHQRRGGGQWWRVSPRVLLMMLLLETKSCMSCPRSQLSAPSDPLFTPLLINRPSSQCKQCLSISQTVLRSVHLLFRGLNVIKLISVKISLSLNFSTLWTENCLKLVLCNSFTWSPTLLQIIFHTPKLPSTVLQPVPETHQKTSTCSFACEMIPLKVRGSDWLVWSFGQTGQVGWKIRDFRSQLFLPKHLCLPQNG